MREKTKLTIAIALILLALALTAWVFLRPAPVPTAETPTAPVPAPEGKAVINLYLADPPDLSAETETLELTLVKAAIVRDGAEIPVFDGATRVTMRRGSSEKVLSASVPSGRLDAVRLTFSPVASAVTPDGRVTQLYMERRTIDVLYGAELALGRTLLGAFRLPLAGALSAKEGVPGARFPERLAMEAVTVGGMRIGDAGRLFKTQGATLADLAQAEYGIDLSSAGNPGTEAVAAPADAAPR